MTEAAQALQATEAVSPLASAMWGLGRVVQTENPQLSFRLLDVPSLQETGDELDGLLHGNLADRQFLLRDGQLHTPRLVPISADPARPSLQPSGTYLITGGTGALGLQTAAWLVNRGARSLVLLAHRPPSEAASLEIAALEAAGCRVLVRQADVSVREQLAQVLDEIAATLPPLTGVIHSAGVLNEGLLLRQEWERFLPVLTPKVVGAWNLHELTAHLPLQLFVCYSSVASVLGTPGQGSYAMGNAFLDGLAQLRRSQGLPALSASWGAWSGGGMADRDDVRQMLPRIGVKFLTAPTAFDLLEDLLAADPGHALVAEVDWPLLVRTLPSVLQLMPQAARVQTPPSASAGIPAILAAARPEDREGILLRELRLEVARILQLAGPEQVPGDRLLSDLGVDRSNAVGSTALATECVERKLAASFAAGVAGYARLIGTDKEGTRKRRTRLRGAAVAVSGFATVGIWALALWAWLGENSSTTSIPAQGPVSSRAADRSTQASSAPQFLPVSGTPADRGTQASSAPQSLPVSGTAADRGTQASSAPQSHR